MFVKLPPVGHTHGDTRAFDESELLGAPDGHLVEIKCYYGDDGVHGFEATYDFPSMGGRFSGGPHYSHQPAHTSTLSLDRDEYIIEITGRKGAIVDQLSVKTNKGKMVTWGGHGGEPFSLNIPVGKGVIAFHGGFGGHIHNLGVYVKDIPYIPPFVPAPVPAPGPFMPAPGPFVPAPAPFVPAPAPHVPHHPLRLKGKMHKTSKFGKKHSDSHKFDDKKIIKDADHGKICEVQCFFDDHILGLVVRYFVDGHVKEGGSRISAHGGYRVESLQLGPDEYITEFGGRCGDLIDQIHIRTNLGREARWGGNGGVPFVFDIPHGSALSALKGGYANHLHLVKGFYQKLEH
eukprot:GILI01006178.1.p1 GENE.GILI01006178.1~~GILI01006178.1.p1  ORF type:complete len:356 (-),score=102.15 GILI01006178.1:271-1308(-)